MLDQIKNRALRYIESKQCEFHFFVQRLMLTKAYGWRLRIIVNSTSSETLWSNLWLSLRAKGFLMIQVPVSSKTRKMWNAVFRIRDFDDVTSSNREDYLRRSVVSTQRGMTSRRFWSDFISMSSLDMILCRWFSRTGQFKCICGCNVMKWGLDLRKVELWIDFLIMTMIE
jgi:hypothetical protein